MWQCIPVPSDGNCLYHAVSEALQRSGLMPARSCDAQLLRRLTFSLYTLPYPADATPDDDERRVWLSVAWPQAADAAVPLFRDLNELVEPLWRQVRTRTIESHILTPAVHVTREMARVAHSAPALQRFYFPLMYTSLRKRVWGDEVHLALLERMFEIHCVVLDGGLLLRQPAMIPRNGYVFLQRHARVHYTLLALHGATRFSHAQYSRIVASPEMVIDGVHTRLRVEARGDAGIAAAATAPCFGVLEHAMRCLAVSQALFALCRAPGLGSVPGAGAGPSALPRCLWSCSCSAEVLHASERCAFCLLTTQ